MKLLNSLSTREKNIAIAVAVVGLVLVADALVRAGQNAVADLKTREAGLQKQWSYSAAVLQRAEPIETAYADLRSLFPFFFEDGETTRVMADLDAAAKQAGVRVDMIRPVLSDKFTRYEVSFSGSWEQVLQFFRNAEGEDHFFDFPVITIRRQDPSGDLAVAVLAERLSL